MAYVAALNNQVARRDLDKVVPAAISAIDRVGPDLGERHERHRLPFVTGERHLPAAFHPRNHGDF
jgi:hypothetical protein